MSKTIKRIWNFITTILVIIVLGLAISLVGMRLLGFQVYTVLSGSMEPNIHTGSLLYVKDVDTDTLQPNDVITYLVSEDTVVTHRIVALVPSEEEPGLIRFRTKGDANNVEDGTMVHPKNVLGTPVFSLPYLGYVADFIQNPPGTYMAISLGAMLLILIFLPDLLFSDEEKKPQVEEVQKQTETVGEP